MSGEEYLGHATTFGLSKDYFLVDNFGVNVVVVWSLELLDEWCFLCIKPQLPEIVSVSRNCARYHSFI